LNPEGLGTAGAFLQPSVVQKGLGGAKFGYPHWSHSGNSAEFADFKAGSSGAHPLGSGIGLLLWLGF
jgi:hypothetical protein